MKLGSFRSGSSARFPLGAAWLRSWLTADGADLVVCSEATGRSREISIRTSRPPGLDHEPLEPHAFWSMARGLSGRGSHDVLEEALAWLESEVGEPCRVDEILRAMAPARRRLRAQLREVGRHLVAGCDPALRRLALRFRPGVRFRLYCLLAGDRSGRLTQLAVAAPGALIFALGLLTRPGRGLALGQRLLWELSAGHRRELAVGDACAGWLAGGDATAGEQLALFGPTAPAPSPTVAGTPEAAALRLLVRRAGPLVAPSCLLAMPPAVLVPEDIPVAPRDNAAWYRLMDAHTALRGHEQESEARLALAGFASRHALALFAAAVNKHALRDFLADLLDYLVATGRLPSRATDPGRLLDESRVWHAKLAAVTELVELRAAAGLPVSADDATDFPLPELPGSAWKSGDVEVSPIRTALELLREGNELRHCVASRLRAAVERRVYLFAVRIAGERLTVELVVGGEGRLSMNEVRGIANRSPSSEERAALQPWIVSLLPLEKVYPHGPEAGVGSITGPG